MCARKVRLGFFCATESVLVQLLPENGQHRLSRKPDRTTMRVAGDVIRMNARQGQARTKSPLGLRKSFSADAADDPVKYGLRASARRMVGVAAFSGVINILMLSG